MPQLTGPLARPKPRSFRSESFRSNVATFYQPAAGLKPNRHKMLPADHTLCWSESDAEKRVDRVADEAAVGGPWSGQYCVRPGVDHGQRAWSVEVIG